MLISYNKLLDMSILCMENWLIGYVIMLLVSKFSEWLKDQYFTWARKNSTDDIVAPRMGGVD